MEGTFPVRRMRRSGRWLACAAIFAAVTACYPERSVDSSSDLDLVATARDPGANFASFNTFAVVDDVAAIGDGTDPVAPATAAAIVNRIRDNMASLGFAEVDPTTTFADVYVAAGVTTNSNTLVGWVDGWYDWWGGWGYWPPYYGPGWGWGYPGYWYSYSYDTGTLAMVMVQGGASAPSTESPVLWVGTLNGILSGSSDLGRVLAGIDQAFDQSPYLGGQ